MPLDGLPAERIDECSTFRFQHGSKFALLNYADPSDPKNVRRNKAVAALSTKLWPSVIAYAHQAEDKKASGTGARGCSE